MPAISRPLFTGLYQLGFVVRDLDRAMDNLGRRFGVTRYREQRGADRPTETAHAYAGEIMLELLKLNAGAHPVYLDFVPDSPDGARLHHQGYRVPTAARWEDIGRLVAANGWDVPMSGVVRNGGLSYIYVDTRADLGIYSEFVFLQGEGLSVYDDVPHN